MGGESNALFTTLIPILEKVTANQPLDGSSQPLEFVGSAADAAAVSPKSTPRRPWQPAARVRPSALRSAGSSVQALDLSQIRDARLNASFGAAANAGSDNGIDGACRPPQPFTLPRELDSQRLLLRWQP